MTLLRRILLGFCALLLVLAAVGLIGLRVSGAWNVVFPSRTHEDVAPAIPDSVGRPALLLFTKTNAFRHIDAIEAGSQLFETVADERGWSIFHTENGAVFNERDLSRFDAVVFHCTSGDVFDESQEAAFQDWLEGGGGWLGTHAAGDGSHAGWRWYVDNLIGSDYVAHILNPQFQSARVIVEDRDHPATANLPETWSHLEEWYSWEESNRAKGFSVLARIDESSYTPEMEFMGQKKDLRMGDHPVLWKRCVGRGRSLYSALGHRAEAYTSPEVRSLLEGGLAWVIGAEGSGCR